MLLKVYFRDGKFDIPLISLTNNDIAILVWKFKRKYFFDNLTHFASYGHLAQIVCTILAENEWYKKSFAWLARPRQARFRNRQSPIGTEIWIGTKWLSVLSLLTEWIQSCILLSVIEVWIVFMIQSIHDNSWYPYSAYKKIYCVIVKAYYNCHSYEGMSNLWRYVKLYKVCRT